MDFRVLGGAGVAGVVVTAMLAAPAGADTLAGSATQAGPKISVCTIAGSVSSTPALSYTPASIKYTVEGTMSCARTWVGKLSGEGAGTMACEAGKSDATFNVAWKNGKKSTLTLSMADFAWGSGGVGKVSQGVLKGVKASVAWARESAGAEAKCAAGGVASYQFAGGVSFNG